MTMAEDDPFDFIVDELNLNTDTSDVVDVTKLSTEDLLNLRHELDEELLNGSEMLNPHTQEGRDRHSLRNAVQLELKKRLIDD